MNATGVGPRVPNALTLTCNMQLYVCVQNSFDADRQRRAGAHGLAARFVYVFREARQKRHRPDSAECGTRKLNFEVIKSNSFGDAELGLR